jgi:hypothetical protein
MKKFKFLTIITLFALAFVSCEDEKTPDDGLSQDINDLISDENLAILEELGMPINKGTQPPALSKIYLLSPDILLNSNRDGDVISTTYADFKVKFYDQSSNKLDIKIDFKNGSSTGTGLGSFVAGSGDKFTVFSEITSTNGSYSAKLAYVFSGTIVAGGLEDFHVSLIMLDDYGDPGGIYIEVGDARVFHDSDGFSGEIGALFTGEGDNEEKFKYLEDAVSTFALSNPKK